MSLSLRLSAKELVVGGHIPEILQTIFEQALLTAERGQWWSYREDIWSLLRAITTVSRAWYMRARDCPWLWRNIFNSDVDVEDLPLLWNVLYQKYQRHRPPGHMHGYGLFLKRAGAVPLRVHASNVLPLLGMLKRMNTSQLSNVEELIVECPSEMYGEWLADVNTNRHATVQQRLLNLSLPSLKILVLNNVTFEVPWFKAFISRHSSIGCLILSNVSFERHTELTKNAVVLPNLEVFGIESYDMGALDTCFSVISAAKLRTVSINMIDVEGGVLEAPPPDGRWGQWDSVQVLKIRGPLYFNELRGLLLLARNLQVLEVGTILPIRVALDGSALDAIVLVDLLVLRDENPLRLPYFTTLRMDKDCVSATSAADVPFNKLVTSRSQSSSVSPLVEIGLRGGRSVWDGWLARAAEFAGTVRLVQWDPNNHHLWV